ncbi:MAG: alpha-isopropylmalate synthase regulatory domain-containing protein [Lachnospiraceae bacterium]|nr:alpha-isopropylmalate synthase regulatory domain-containing protein [Lachnospiraceae bacterium]
MREVRISDVSMKLFSNSKEVSLTFKKKLELAKLLDKLSVGVIEAEGIEQEKVDSLRIKSMASAVKNSVLAVPLSDMSKECADLTWASVKEANHPRLQVVAAVSPAQMEYIHHMKADKMFAKVTETIEYCKTLTDDVEFIADDATRSDVDFLYKVIDGAINAGATTVTVSDAAGTMLPAEFTEFVNNIYENVPALKDVVLGIACSNDLSMADACAVAGIIAGAGEVKTSAYPLSCISLPNIARIIANKEDVCKASCSVRTTELKRVCAQIQWLLEIGRTSTSAFDGAVSTEGADIILNANDDMDAVAKVCAKLGYDLSEEDIVSVYKAFSRIASKKGTVTGHELDAIIASSALQVPPTYTIDGYLITMGDTAGTTALIKLKKDDEVSENVAIGDGPVDAAFLAIEGITGSHYELDDFQIKAVTEGAEAMGETIVKLRSEGKVYSGRGISVDVVGSSIRAYVNALNKIVYEEHE